MADDLALRFAISSEHVGDGHDDLGARLDRKDTWGATFFAPIATAKCPRNM